MKFLNFLKVFFDPRVKHYINESPPVTTESGPLKGQTLKTPNKQVFHSFQGIPYAKPPVGNLRFMPPEPVEPWSEVRTAYVEGNVAIQRTSRAVAASFRSLPSVRQFWAIVKSIPGIIQYIIRQSYQSEDCLYLNVYTPQLPSEDKTPLPVMVFFHGGAFMLGSGDSDLYGPEFFMDAEKKVVLVTGNYRLGAFGFLSYEAGGVPGNAGMRDQVAMLQWVQRNIASFGGDPNRVTIFGESAGGISVHLHLLSPMSKGLFHRAIAQSGSALASRLSVSSDVATNRAKKLASLCEIPVDSLTDSEIVKRLQEVPAKELAQITPKVLTDEDRKAYVFMAFIPTVEAGLTKAEKFLTDFPKNLILNGDIAQVPFVIGVNSAEAKYFMSALRNMDLAKFEAEMENAVPDDIVGLERQSPEVKALAQKMKEFYFKGEPLSQSTIYQFMLLSSDAFMNIITHRTINIHSQKAKAPFYAYIFSHDGNLAFSNRLLDTGMKGVGHLDELSYLFPMQVLSFQRSPTEDDWKVQKTLMRLWTNIAHNGDPNDEVTRSELNLEWPPANVDKGAYLDISANPTVGYGFISERMKFWDQYYTVEDGGTATSLLFDDLRASL